MNSWTARPARPLMGVRMTVAIVASAVRCKSSANLSEFTLHLRAISRDMALCAVPAFQQTTVFCMANRAQFERDLSVICGRLARQVF